MPELSITSPSEETSPKSEDNFRRFLDNAPLGARIVSEGGETIYANQSLLDIYGYKNIEEFKYSSVKKRYTPASYTEFLLRREKRQRGELVSSEYEIDIVRKDGEVRHLRVFRKEIIWNGDEQYQVLYLDITKQKQAEEERNRLIQELREALSEVRTLSGLLPICASCKKIRDDKGYWSKLESYISDHSEAEFSHGICPECLEKLQLDNTEEENMKLTSKPIILLVDDEEDFRMIFIRQIKKILKDQEFEFIEASDGEEALRLLQNGVKPSFILVDYTMPRINGVEFLKKMDQDHPELHDVPRFMISGYSREEVINEAQALGCAFFEKTIDNKTFFQLICRDMAHRLGFA